MIDGEHITKDDTFDSINPANTSELIAKVSKATKEDVDKAFESSNKAYKAWRQWSHKDRAELLLRVAQLFAVVKRKSLQSWYMKQVNLGMRLLAMQREGIDFIEYYARSMMELADGKPVLDREGEHNKYFYKSIGTGVTIPPWNFPFAIMAVQH